MLLITVLVFLISVNKQALVFQIGGSEVQANIHVHLYDTKERVIDYVLVSENMLHCITSFDVGYPNPFSDHYGVQFTFSNIGTAEGNSNTYNTYQHVRCKSIWKGESKEYGVSNILGSHAVRSKFAVLCKKSSNSNTVMEVESCINDFATILDSCSYKAIVTNVPDYLVIETVTWFTDTLYM